ncbi:MAG: polyhydroxyalkanoate depolymerase [Alphaproteobacteria bacterium]|nr:MAG: polyhydroxyalkanoate depolymerase [Alphaproteobacteria bacterium]
MLYHWYEFGHAAAWPGRAAAEMWLQFFHPLNPLTHTSLGRSAAAGCELYERATRRYAKPGFGIRATKVGERSVTVTEETLWTSPFCRVVHFKREICPTLSASQPRLLLVAPMSGHFATLLRGTVEAFLPNHEVYITDWQDARNVPVSMGRFDLDDYIDTIMAIFRSLGRDLHVLAVCQPSVPVLAATALMEANGDPSVPRSLVLAGGPIDTRVNPTAVNRLAQDKGTAWFERNVISTVPWPSEGCGRAVYPGFLQLTGFMSMNLDRHVQAQRDMFLHLVRGDGDSAAKHRKFYDEYLAVMDLTAEFYLQTIDSVFVRHVLPRGVMTSRGRPVDLRAIRRPAIMTVEGEKDDITGKDQCKAALELCNGVPSARKSHFKCPAVGHYGIFNGSRFRHAIAPRVSAFLRRHGSEGILNRPKSRIVAGSGIVSPVQRPACAVRSIEAEALERAA